MASSSFTPRERELIRREFCRHFGQDPAIADGIFLRTWHSGRRWCAIPITDAGR
jgi:hypothetical protein